MKVFGYILSIIFGIIASGVIAAMAWDSTNPSAFVVVSLGLGFAA
jgi:hypothetical protein